MTLGVVGIAVGGIVGTIRGTTPILFALASGIQVATLGFMYTGQSRNITCPATSDALDRNRTICDRMGRSPR